MLLLGVCLNSHVLIFKEHTPNKQPTSGCVQGRTPPHPISVGPLQEDKGRLRPCLDTSATNQAKKRGFCLVPRPKCLHSNSKAWRQNFTFWDLAQEPSRTVRATPATPTPAPRTSAVSVPPSSCLRTLLWGDECERWVLQAREGGWHPPDDAGEGLRRPWRSVWCGDAIGLSVPRWFLSSGVGRDTAQSGLCPWAAAALISGLWLCNSAENGSDDRPHGLHLSWAIRSSYYGAFS